MSQFVDECQLNVRGGDGGAGCVSFRREGPVVRGGPNGGDGGKGGDIWFVADHNVASLIAFRDHPHRRADNGVHGKGKDLHGRRGESLEIKVPEGTIVRDMYTGEMLAELFRHGDRYLAAHGGRGGRGNARFLSNYRREPTFAEQGEHDPEVRFLIKELGDFTTNLYQRVKAGNEVVVEGPYGRLEFDVNKPQVWIAGGVGIASFFAILSSLKTLKRHPPVHLFYCTRGLDSHLVDELWNAARQAQVKLNLQKV